MRVLTSKEIAGVSGAGPTDVAACVAGGRFGMRAGAAFGAAGGLAGAAIGCGIGLALNNC